jgi:hypothetical protein
MESPCGKEDAVSSQQKKCVFLATIFHVRNPYLKNALFILLSLNTWQMTNEMLVDLTICYKCSYVCCNGIIQNFWKKKVVRRFRKGGWKICICLVKWKTINIVWLILISCGGPWSCDGHLWLVHHKKKLIKLFQHSQNKCIVVSSFGLIIGLQEKNLGKKDMG